MKNRITQVESEYACLWFYPDEGIIHHQFLQPISGDDFKTVLMSGLHLMEEYGAQKWLSDDRKNSILPAEDSAWSQDYWLPRAIQAGWKYWAVLPPIKARGQINMKRLVEYVGERQNIEIEIFSDPDQAWQWLARQSAA
ncbi:MAG: hypothetical protein ABW092_04560 [Candidatus Thiodiazotropha sp.]